MKVNLAGFNVDTTVLNDLEKKFGKREDITPEVLSAAYARISRDSRDITEIRKDARQEVEKSRRSNSTIIFKMGHHSVAEHAVFNFDILNASRLIMEEIEKFRLCSYTEKSQRYITLDNDFVIPQEIKGANLENKFVDMVKEQNKAYFLLLEKLKKHVFEKNANLAEDKKNHSMLEGWAKEDARYITSLATESQVGLTINARNLELMLRRFASHTLDEVKQLGEILYHQVAEVAPSIIIFNEANDRDIKTYSQLKNLAEEILKKKKIFPLKTDAKEFKEVSLIHATEKGDEIIAASLLHTSSALPYAQCKEIISGLSKDEVQDIFKASCKNMQFYDSMLREFEYVNFTYNIILSSACFGQLKRHRMSTITSQEYDPSLGVTIPESIKEVGMEDHFQEIINKTNDVYEAIKRETPAAASYILTNAHRKRVLMRLNARELYHISRLREDAHAQWDIKNISLKMSTAAKEIMPHTFALIGGKDQYHNIYEKRYGNKPKVTEAVLPKARVLNK